MGEMLLLVVDNLLIRRKAEAELKAVNELATRIEGQILWHESKEAPAFAQWVSIHCADLLATRRACEEEAKELRARLTLLHQMAETNFKYDYEAFFWLQAIENQSRAIPPRVKRAWDEVIFGPANWSSHITHHFAPGLAGEEGDKAPNVSDSNHRKMNEDASSETAEYTIYQKDSRSVKRLYRQIVRLLHPDAAGVLSEHELRLWYMAQEAYASGDARALEAVLARCNQVGTNYLSIADLWRLIADARVRVQTLEAYLQTLRGNSAWRFLALDRSARDSLLMHVRAKHLEAIALLKREIEALQRRLTGIARAAQRWAKRQDGDEWGQCQFPF
ncbi:MAG: hypothetical protein JOY96_00230 [Verrucomicrobia bacterium]|nr:hypothetical protein [Verrucomicrobiota bacterium]